MNFSKGAFKKTSIIGAAVFSAVLFSATAFAKVERTVEKTFSVESGAKLSVETSGGNVRVESGDVQRVRIVARQIFPKASTDAEADEAAKSLELVMEQNGASVKASAKYTKSTWWGRTPVVVHFDVTVPRACDVNLNTSGGDISVSDLTGAAKVKTSGGNVKLGQIAGEVNARTSGGNVALAGCTRGAALSTSGGNITAGPVAGNLEATTSGGDITINGVSGSVSARTSGGNVRAKLAAITSDCTLGTSGGDVSVALAKDSALLLDAMTSGGRVGGDGLRIELLAGGNGKNRLSGKVNGGGPRLKLRTSGGNIDVKTN